MLHTLEGATGRGGMGKLRKRLLFGIMQVTPA